MPLNFLVIDWLLIVDEPRICCRRSRNSAATAGPGRRETRRKTRRRVRDWRRGVAAVNFLRLAAWGEAGRVLVLLLLALLQETAVVLLDARLLRHEARTRRVLLRVAAFARRSRRTRFYFCGGGRGGGVALRHWGWSFSVPFRVASGHATTVAALGSLLAKFEHSKPFEEFDIFLLLEVCIGV